MKNRSVALVNTISVQDSAHQGDERQCYSMYHDQNRLFISMVGNGETATLLNALFPTAEFVSLSKMQPLSIVMSRSCAKKMVCHIWQYSRPSLVWTALYLVPILLIWLLNLFRICDHGCSVTQTCSWPIAGRSVVHPVTVIFVWSIQYRIALFFRLKLFLLYWAVQSLALDVCSGAHSCFRLFRTVHRAVCDVGVVPNPASLAHFSSMVEKCRDSSYTEDRDKLRMVGRKSNARLALIVHLISNGPNVLIWFELETCALVSAKSVSAVNHYIIAQGHTEKCVLGVYWKKKTWAGVCFVF